MNKTKINKIIISSYDDLKNPVYAGGGAYSVNELANKLSKKYSVTVITAKFKDSKNTNFGGIRFLKIGSDIFGHKIGQIIFQFALLQYARKSEYDIWIEGSNPPFTFSLLPMFAKKPVISWVHMICSYDMKRKYHINLRFIEKAFCELYKYIIVPTKWVQDEVKNMNKKALIQNIPYGFNNDTASYPKKYSNTKKKILLFIGRIEINQKGLDLLIQALAYSQAKIKIIIAGCGAIKEQEELMELIKRYNVKNKVTFIGKIHGAKKARLFKQASAVVIPSRYETFVTVALESIVNRKPIICFNIPQNSWIPARFAYKVKPFDTKLLARAIDNLTKVNKSKKITADDRRSYIKNFSWNNFTKQVEMYIAKTIV